ncbi:MAG: hypothetical protein AAF911_03655 [Planctomycetota bacterium]
MPDTFTTLTEPEFEQRIIENPAGVRVSVLANGCLQWIMVGPTMVNLFVGQPLSGGAMRLLIRQHRDGRVYYENIFGSGVKHTDTVVSVHSHGFTWTGRWEDLSYQLDLLLHESRPAWCWKLAVKNHSEAKAVVDAVLVQDVGIADRGQIQNNEAYTSQYIDHQLAEHSIAGTVAMARQNLPQHGDQRAHPWLIHAAADGTAGICTDAFDFFGTDHRFYSEPIPAVHHPLPTRPRQYECASHILQATPRPIAAKGFGVLRFVALFEPDHPTASNPDDSTKLDGLLDEDAWPDPAGTGEAFGERPSRWWYHTALSGRRPSSELLDAWYPPEARRNIERDPDDPDTLLSFFTSDGRHIVLPAKERLVDRRTAHLLTAGRERLPGGDTLSVTTTMAGIFGSQICLGNTSFNKLTSVSRDPLGVIRDHGLRLWVQPASPHDGEFYGGRPLSVPSCFEMGRDHCRWIYDLPGRRNGRPSVLTVTVTADHNGPGLDYELSIEGEPWDVRLTMQTVLGDVENTHPAQVAIDAKDHAVEFKSSPDSLIGQKHPEASWRLELDDHTRVLGGDEMLFDDGRRRGLPFVAAEMRGANRWAWRITGELGPVATGTDSFKDRVISDNKEVSSRLGLLGSDAASGVGRLAEALPWFDHNASIHLTAPHGIEQYGGAAWGVRDVCQGPVEWLLARGEMKTVERILEDVFSHQYEDTGAWPQWYMHPPFENIQSDHSHGDVAVWPIIAAVNLLSATGDESWLDRSVVWTQREPPFGFTQTTATIREHIEFAIEQLIAKFVPGTALLSYGDGDWNDSLQPARPEMRESMVSTWTVELFYQALCGWAGVMRRVGDEEAAAQHEATAAAIRDDFNQRLVLDHEAVGLYLHHKDPERTKVLLHPRDTDTGVKHRLLPMIRGIISEIFTPEQARHHAKLIDRHLLAPDGARLMDRPPKYTGGTMKHFQRLESASFFGREIGLMYTHAHLRYSEAMAKLGEARKLFDALLTICPVGLEHTVPNAAPRQANCYFSSSDAAFLNRADSEKHYDQLMHGNVPVNGGWRVYSSGPGIAIGLIVRQWLGLRREHDHLVIDPLLTTEHDGLVARVSILGQACEVTFRISADGSPPQRVMIGGEEVEPVGRAANPYRAGGLLLPCDKVAERLRSPDVPITIEC